MSFPNFALHAAPVNRVASRLSFGESQAWEPKRGVTCHETYDYPPLPLRAPPSGPTPAQDYTGVRRGFMTALRYHDSNNTGAKWLCRCDCGKYEVRLAKKWVKRLDHPDSCAVCQKTYFIVHGVSHSASPQTPRTRQAAIQAHLARSMDGASA